MDMIRTNENTISDDIDMIRTLGLKITALEPDISDYMDMISTAGLKITSMRPDVSDDMDMISTVGLAVSPGEAPPPGFQAPNAAAGRD